MMSPFNSNAGSMVTHSFLALELWGSLKNTQTQTQTHTDTHRYTQTHTHTRKNVSQESPLEDIKPVRTRFYLENYK